MGTKSQSLADWRSVEDDREKYQAYLCSNDWAKLKKAVHKRADGKCERCGLFDIGAVHHLTYARKYAEDLADLAGWCKHCHAHEHAEHWFDPTGRPRLVKLLLESKRPVAPFEVFDHRACLRRDLAVAVAAIDHLLSLSDIVEDNDGLIEAGTYAISERLPFLYVRRIIWSFDKLGPPSFYYIAEACGHYSGANDEWLSEDCLRSRKEDSDG